MHDPRPPHTPWLTPYLTVRDAPASIDFYQRALGFALKDTMEGDDGPQHVEMTYRGELVLMFAPEGAFGGEARSPSAAGVRAPQTFYLYVDDVDAAFARATDAGARAIAVPEDQFWGDRYAAIEDPDGYRWGFARFQGHN